MLLFRKNPIKRKPFGLLWRQSNLYVSLVTGVALLTDVCLFPLYSAAIPPRLRELGYDDIESKTGWLSAAYAAGLILTTFPFTWLSARTKKKRSLLLSSLAFMAIAILLFLFLPYYAAMIISRLLQGASGTGVWVVGLALLAEHVPAESLGYHTGLAMTGFSLGTAIGLPIGAVLYGQLGWRAPSIFALGLVAVDFCLRLLIIERHEAEVWSVGANISTSVPLEDVKACSEPSLSIKSPPSPAPLAPVHSVTTEKEATQKLKVANGLKYNSLKAVTYMLSNAKPITALLISFTNGFLVAGMYNTALVLRLYQRYNLDETHAGFVFFAVAVPSAITSPLSGWLCDRIGPRPLSIICCIGFVPALCLLIIEELPLAAFATILVFLGIGSGLINSPVMVFLAWIATQSEGQVAASHCYGGFNLAFSLSAFVGPIIAGQILEAVGTSVGFKIQIGLTSALFIACAPLAYFYMRMPKNERSKPTSQEAT